jgi:HRAS-like suppressor 3
LNYHKVLLILLPEKYIMESQIDQTSYDETENAMEEEILNGKKNDGSLGCGIVMRQLDENRLSCEASYDIPDNCRPRKGDLIEIKRFLYDWAVYDHWAVYVGDGEVIHVRDGGNSKTTIKLDLLKDVCGESLCRINNLEKAAQTIGLKPRTVGAILNDAYEMLEKEFVYHPINNNCEHFVTRCRFGSKFSEQASAAKLDPTGFTAIAVKVATDVIMGTKSFINDSTKEV